ncbi:replication initiator protein A [Benzoatithermus flavus]|jgi:plasmid replication initiation protein|uniref:Replication initiator protein A n=1 Tax=Benzoatithermus flavus TaxID=3108223 RepID=A0ABU8XYA9_9PROT
MTETTRDHDEIPAILASYFADLPTRSFRDVMERPFFAIAKSRRTRPIEYAETRDDGSISIRIDGKPGVGIATIWDHDVMLWATSQIVDRLNRGLEPSPRLRFAMNELLRAIGRTDARGKAQATRYEELRAALERLRTTSVVIVATERRGNQEKRTRVAFSWLDSVGDIKEDGEPDRAEITLSRWFYQGITAGRVLAIDPAYFRLTGGLERMLYLLARKHCGQQPEWEVRPDTLYAKTGCEDAFRNFMMRLRRLARADRLPGYTVGLEGDETVVVFRRRTPADAGS